MKYLLIAISLTAMAYANIARADMIVLDAVDRGWYANDGGHLPDNLNYLAGNSTTGFVFRNFFIFDLTGIDQPIVSAELQLGMMAYGSFDPTETYTLFDVATSPSVLMSGLGGIPAFNDLGSGTIHGSFTATAADSNTTLNIPLNAAALGSINAASGFWATGGAITTLDNDPGTVEHLFSGTQLLPLSATRLVIHTIPAPAALPLLLMPALFGRRRRIL